MHVWQLAREAVGDPLVCAEQRVERGTFGEQDVYVPRKAEDWRNLFLELCGRGYRSQPVERRIDMQPRRCYREADR